MHLNHPELVHKHPAHLASPICCVCVCVCVVQEMIVADLEQCLKKTQETVQAVQVLTIISISNNNITIIIIV